jgi:serine/threonine protein kinase
MPQDAPGPTLNSVGNYHLLEKVAEGGMGTVYKGRHRDTGEIVAIKIVADHIISNETLLQRFEKEYKAASQLNHPNIVRALEYGSVGTTPYLVMEYVDGESLGQRLERVGRMSEGEARNIIIQVANALQRAHKNKLIHRDVKPDNVLLTKDGRAKLADLGLVKELETDLNLTKTGRGLGTPHFMAPEQFKDAKNADLRCDIYSMAATLYMMVTGELPFRSNGALDAYMKKIENKLTAPLELVPTLSERIDWAIRRAMSADPERRPASCREFVEDLTGKSARRLAHADESSVPVPDLWYVIFKDADGVPRTAKGNTAGICRSLREDRMGEVGLIRASRSKEGPFEPLRNCPEFRPYVIGPAPLNVAAGKPNVSAAGSSYLAVRPARDTKPQGTSDEPTQPALSSMRSERTPVPRIDLLSKKQGEGGSWPLWLQVLMLTLIVVASAAVGFLLIFRH